MNTKSFLLGTLTGLVVGILLTLGFFFVVGLSNLDSVDALPIDYLEKPVSYENKSQTSFKVLQVIGDAALANEISNEKYDWYHGNTVLLLGKSYYSDQIITVKNPQRVGTYSYTNNGGMPMTVPVIDGKMQE